MSESTEPAGVAVDRVVGRLTALDEACYGNEAADRELAAMRAERDRLRADLARMLRYMGSRHRKRDGYFWGRVADACGLGSTSATEFCQRLGIDPHTGKALTPNARLSGDQQP